MNTKQILGIVFILVGSYIGLFVTQSLRGVEVLGGAPVAVGIGFVCKWIPFKKSK